ncbi:MAG: type 1 glutamine amidotransferase-like domain-containing protein [bacterium]|nr:type 1 glutamine amidotransferase-like domain-containing protein [bacterium]
MLARSNRLDGDGWLALIGGGEFSFGETRAADAAWLEKTPAGPVAFMPTASGSADYAAHFSTYVTEALGREATTVPIYRARDARRRKNLDRISEAGAVYIGGGIADALLEVLADSPAREALEKKINDGGMVVAIAAAAQALSARCRSLTGREALTGLAWLPGTAVEVNFDPAHDRRLRELLEAPGMKWGIGLPSGSAVLFGPDGRLETSGPVMILEEPEGDWKLLREGGHNT